MKDKQNLGEGNFEFCLEQVAISISAAGDYFDICFRLVIVAQTSG